MVDAGSGKGILLLVPIKSSDLADIVKISARSDGIVILLQYCESKSLCLRGEKAVSSIHVIGMHADSLR